MSTFESRILQKTKNLRDSKTSKEFEDQVDYLLKSIPFIKKYEEQRTKDESVGVQPMDSDPQEDQTTSTPKGSATTMDNFVDVSTYHETGRVYDEYLAMVEGDEDAIGRICVPRDRLINSYHPALVESNNKRKSTPKINSFSTSSGIEDSCEKCGGRCVFDTAQSMCICTECGVCSQYIEGSVRNLSYTEQVERGNKKTFTYKRISHFCETLASVQGKQKTTIPDEVIAAVCHEIKKHRMQIDDVTPKHVRDFLKRLGYPKFYEANNYILNIIQGKQRVVIPQELEDKLIHMFIRIQKPFEDACDNGRKNFLRYHFIIYKLLQLLGEEGEPYLHLFPLLKSTLKLAQHDTVWKRICEAVGFEFIPTT